MGTETISLPAPAAERRKEREKPATAAGQLSGTLWFGGWLFTVGFAHLVWWKAILALIAWPYFLGIELRP